MSMASKRKMRRRCFDARPLALAGHLDAPPHAVPILLPMTTGALMLLLKEERQRSKIMLSTLSLVLGLVVAIALLHWSSQHPPPACTCRANWAAPFGISLVLDRLSALMLVLTYAIALAASVFAMARWYKVGVHFYVLFQFQLMGLAGAFLTGTCSTCLFFLKSCWPHRLACCCMAPEGCGCKRGCTTLRLIWWLLRCF